jgi:hypothetical protein
VVTKIGFTVVISFVHFRTSAHERLRFNIAADGSVGPAEMSNRMAASLT